MNARAIVVSAVLACASGHTWAAAVEAASTGVWVNPLPATATIDGVGTSVFTWGNIGFGTGPNELVFNGVGAISSALETPFKVGSIRYFNGSVTNPAESVALRLELAFSQPVIPPVVGDYGFGIFSTTNTNDPDESADVLTLPSGFSSTEFLIGSTIYRVQLVGFSNVEGDGFLTSNSTEFRVREGLFATADLFARVTVDQPVIPVPATLPMLVSGLAALVVFARRQRRAAKA